ncbi:MAG: hypothetical protein N2044_00405 [Cyclobacteriaceae bacterium]|nr:hypothetical protein [Cyclobacteriaceae bacterium]
MLLALTISPLWAQKDGKDVSIPLDHFYVERQGSGIFRKMLSKLTFGLSTGYGSAAFRHQLDGWVVYQPSAGAPLLYNPANPSQGYTNWFNRIATAPLSVNPSDFQVNSDTAKVGFRSKSFQLPLRATVHVEFAGRYRIGGGYALEYTRVGEFRPLTYTNDIQPFSPDFSGFLMKKYFVSAGVSFYRYDNYLFSAELNIGGFSMGNKFDKAAMDKSLLIGLGFPVERELSEYFRIFIRPSYEFRNFTLNIPEESRSIRHRFNAFYLNIGATYRIPELPRCFEPKCRAQVNHAHGNREYRSRVHPIWKKQNPHYGENYPTLIRYKGKNRRKLNPY